MAVKRIKRRQVKTRRPGTLHAFTSDEDNYIIFLKEGQGYSWIDISNRFNRRFPNTRNHGALQVRYSRYLQPSKRGKSPKKVYDSESENDFVNTSDDENDPRPQKPSSGYKSAIQSEQERTTTPYHQRIAKKKVTSKTQFARRLKMSISKGDSTLQANLTSSNCGAASSRLRRSKRSTKAENPQYSDNLMAFGDSFIQDANSDDSELSDIQRLVPSDGNIKAAMGEENVHHARLIHQYSVASSDSSDLMKNFHASAKRLGSTKLFDKLRRVEQRSLSQSELTESTVDSGSDMQQESATGKHLGPFVAQGWIPVNHHIEKIADKTAAARIFKCVPAGRILERHIISGSYRLRARTADDPVFEKPIARAKPYIDVWRFYPEGTKTANDLPPEEALAYVNGFGKAPPPIYEDFATSGSSGVLTRKRKAVAFEPPTPQFGRVKKKQNAVRSTGQDLATSALIDLEQVSPEPASHMHAAVNGTAKEGVKAGNSHRKAVSETVNRSVIQSVEAPIRLKTDTKNTAVSKSPKLTIKLNMSTDKSKKKTSAASADESGYSTRTNLRRALTSTLGPRAQC